MAGVGYTLPNLPQDAAPGQLLLLSLYGIKTSISTPHLATPTPTGWPTSIDGITVELVQGYPPYVNTPTLRVSEGGHVVGGVFLRPVSENAHVLNTCDATLIYISAAN